jgi:hypothetical protein
MKNRPREWYRLQRIYDRLKQRKPADMSVVEWLENHPDGQMADHLAATAEFILIPKR